MTQLSSSNLPDGSELLNDSESFLADLSDTELQISGGGKGGFGGPGFGGPGFGGPGFGGPGFGPGFPGGFFFAGTKKFFKKGFGFFGFPGFGPFV
jgi:hypothetical protein